MADKIKNIIFNNLKWDGFSESVKLAKEYKTFFSGVDVYEHLRTVKKRETEEELKERIECTNFLNNALFNSIRKNIDKLSFLNVNESVINKSDLVETNIRSFSNGNGLKDYIFSNLLDKTLIDPNALLYLYVNDKGQIKSEFIKSESIVYKTFDSGVVKDVVLKVSDGYVAFVDNKRFYFKKVNDAGVIVETDLDLFSNGFVTDGSVTYKVEVSGLAIVPFISLGFKNSLFNDGVFVSYLDPALPFFKKLTSIVSEYDVTELKQAFPKVFAYEKPCNSCNNGYDVNGSECSSCSGSGVLLSKSGQDVVTFPLPDISRGGAELQDLSKLYKEFSAPISTLEYQIKVIEGLFVSAKESIFGKENQPNVNKTATSRIIELESTNQSLYPLANSISSIYKAIYKYSALILGVDDTSVIFSFPQKLIELNESELLQLIESSKKNNLPRVITAEYTNRLASIVFKDNFYKNKLYDVNKLYNPLSDSSISEMLVLRDSKAISQLDFVISVNFDNFTNRALESFLIKGISLVNVSNKDVYDEVLKIAEDYISVIEKDIEITI